MADSIVEANAGTGGALFAVDAISGTTYPYTKIILGTPGQDNDPISSSNPMPVTASVSALPVVTATVQGTSSVNVLGNIPGTTQVNIVSSIPLGFTPTGTSVVNIGTSIPFYVSQSTSPWLVNGGVNVSTFAAVVSTFATGGTQEVSITTSIPFYVAQSSAPWTVIGGVGVTNTALVSSRTFTSIPIWVSQSSAPWSVNASVSAMPVVNASITALPVAPLSSTWTRPTPSTSGGLLTFSRVSVTTAAQTIKSSAGQLFGVWFTNTGSSTRWLKFYSASNAAIGTTLPLLTFGMPGNSSAAIAGLASLPYGIQFTSSMFVGVTASSATSSDTSAPGSGEIVLNCFYK